MKQAQFAQSQLNIYLDVDNFDRYKIKNSIYDSYLKDCLKKFRLGEEKLTFSIANLGIVEVKAYLADYKNKSLIIKSDMVFDYGQQQEFGNCDYCGDEGCGMCVPDEF